MPKLGICLAAKISYNAGAIAGQRIRASGAGRDMTSPIIDRIMDEQDRDFIRVLEDLIDVLIARGVITMDMLPKDSTDKLAMRRQMRTKLTGAADARRDTTEIDQRLAALRFRE